MAFARFVALGDSTTEGLEDLAVGGAGYVGFADRLAALLARENPELLYANLAIRGRKAAQVRSEQLATALALEPDLATVVAGVNDILRPRVDLLEVLNEVEAMMSALREAGATVVGMTFPDPTGVMPAARPVRGRVLIFNQGLRAIATRCDIVLVDLARDAIVDARLWADDRLHANATGHARIAAATARALGLETDDPWTPLPPLEPSSRTQILARELAWTVKHMAPWISRRIRGRSSGDGIVAKRPELAPVEIE